MAEQNILNKLDKPTYLLEMELIQDIINKGRMEIKLNNYDKNFWDHLCELLWKHLRAGFKKFDDQLLCATCFYTVIKLSNKVDHYINEVLEVIRYKSKTALVLSMMYGLFQSPFLTHKVDKINGLELLLNTTFDLLLEMGYEYTQYTFIVFKTIRTFKKVCGTDIQEYIFNKSNQIKLLNLINHNWENPITGIRDLIRSIFQTLITTVDEEMYVKIIEELNNFYWNKAKYLMLTEIIEYSHNMPQQIMEKELIDGLIYSLHKPGLVSAGADMYYALLKTVKSEQMWCDIFLHSIMELLTGLSIKPIENFSNYWCLTTVKTFPKVLYIILDAIEFAGHNENTMFSYLCIMKQGNKLGILSDNHKKITMVTLGLEDNNPKTRMVAFDIVCVRQGKMLPGARDYQLILEFINNNINTDCTVLRLSMLGSITNFFTQLHVLFLNNVNDEDETMLDILSFCKKFQELIIKSLILNGNYQRKITTVKLCNIFMSNLSEIHRKKKDQTRKIKISLMDFIKEKKYFLLCDKEFVSKLLSLLKDPADDIRDNTMKLLLNHYLDTIKDATILNNLIQNALECMKSKFFYEISCGQTMFKLISNLLLKNNVEDAIFKNVDDIFLFSYEELVTESKLQRNIMNTIENGKQMHSWISILHVVLETYIYNSMKLPYLDNFVYKLLDILVDTSKQFSWDKGNSTSSDFSKMNDMVQDIIIKSGYNLCDDLTKISGLHQIVLNCLWLNVKACCDLAALLILYYTDNIGVSKKCLALITHVLETSRHKGVIEAAGAALGKSIQHLTCVQESEVSELPMALLKEKLDDMIMAANEMSSITRRGAGLSIMVHRIVSSDMKKDKPLFHYFMETLLGICNKIDDVPIMDDQDSENQTDLPKALYIHFLTRIVTDSSLASDMMYYSTDLSMLAFKELTNSHWQIRNAALQLYGALVPKLVGQKKPSGTDDETVATVACDELRTHSTKLWGYIMKVLQHRECLDSLITHSNFVPLLNMLANSAKSYNFTYDTGFKKWEKQLLNSLMTLLGSPIFTVRRLTAKCIYNIYSFDDIFNSLMHLERMTENLINGILMLIEIMHKYYSNQYHKCFQKLQVKFSKVLATGNHYYLSKAIFENVFYIDVFDLNSIRKTLLETNNNKQAPGIFLWAHNKVRKYIMKSSLDKIPMILKIVLDQDDFEIYLKFVDEKLELYNTPEEIFKEIVESMILFENNKSSSLIWKILYKISSTFDLGPYIDVGKLMKDLEGKRLYKLRYIIPLIATTLINAEESIQIQFAKLVSSLSDSNRADVDMRHIAIVANNEIASIFNNITDVVRVIVIKTAIVFLQDEDDDLRSLSTHFYKKLNNSQVTVHAYICLERLLDPTFLVTIFDEPKAAINKLCKDLDGIIISNTTSTVDEYNPFANDAKNIYLEAEVLKEFIWKLNNIHF